MRWVFGVILVWLIFVMSLAAWWLYFGITILSQVASYNLPVELEKHQTMLLTEGSVLLASLFFGGIALFYFSYRMYKEKSAKEIFFASFTHDLKTALFRMQLEVEKLDQESGSSSVRNILNHTRKMHLDLENGLDSAVGQDKELFLEKVKFSEFLLELHAHWPEFRIKKTGVDSLLIDKKALHSILKNLLHNSFVHGQADEVFVDLKAVDKNCCIHYSDNGTPFSGDLASLGHSPQYSHKGSGFGLYIVRTWVERLGGKIKFGTGSSQSLEIEITVPGGAV